MKKLLLSILIGLALVGIFGVAKKANAQVDVGICRSPSGGIVPVTPGNPCNPPNRWQVINTSGPPAPDIAPPDGGSGFCKLVGTEVWAGGYSGTQCAKNPGATFSNFLPDLSDPKSFPKSFQELVSSYQCGLGGLISLPGAGTLGGCLLQFSFYVFYQVPAFILWGTGQFFNVLVSITISDTLLRNPFISEGWGVVRDLSNIFFILILLYIAIRLILGLGGHDTKKMITHVIIVALLINFSMFMTQVVIDTTNVISLIFYNKLDTRVVTADGTKRVPTNYAFITTSGEKDISGGMVQAFDPTRLLSEDFFKAAAASLASVPGLAGSSASNIPISFIIGMCILTGLVMLFAAYAFFVSGISFVGRLIELFVLIIFSPFAFMSSTVHILSGTEYIGWDAWFKRLMKVAFMAPIFMFFLYFIFKLVNAGIFKGALNTTNSIIGLILSIVLPALLVLVLLLKATEFAKKGAGTVGEYLMKGAGIAMGAALGTAAFASRGTLGRAGAAVAESGWAKRWESAGYLGGAFRSGAKALGTGSLDLRGAKIAGMGLGSATGLNLGEAGGKGGFVQRRKEQVAKRMERAKELEVGEDEKLKQGLNQLELAKQEALKGVIDDIETLDKRLEVWRKKQTDSRNRQATMKANPAAFTALEMATADAEATKAANVVRELNLHRSAIKNGRAYTVGDADAALHGEAVGTAVDYSTRARVNHGGVSRSINDFEDILIPDAHHKINAENRKRKWKYAETTEGWGQIKDFLLSGGQHSFAGAREAAHKIKMEAKLDDKGGHH